MKTRQAGFSLIELLVVVGIIVILAAVSLPAISQYMRNYQIKGATQQVAGQIQIARTRAIMRNVNRSALFLVLSPTTYQWVMPDQSIIPPGDPRLPAGGWRTLAELQVDPAQAGPVYTLPVSLEFDTTGTTTSVLGFNRLGAQCDPTAGVACGTPPIDLTGAPGANYVVFDAATGQATINLLQRITGLRRTVTIMSGGRVLAQP
jgi:prepilin-type N-terminal cleavage/methylation domain-containing protein